MTRFRPLSIRLNVGWAAAGNLTYGLSQWFAMVVLARLDSAQAVGHYAFALAVSAPVFLFFDGRLREVQATDAVEEFRFREYVLVRAIGMMVAGTGVLLLGGILASSGEQLAIVGAVAALKMVEGWADIAYGRLQRAERLDLPARAQATRALLSIGVLTGVLWSSGNVALSIAAAAGAQAVAVALLDFRWALAVASRTGGQDDPRGMKRLFKLWRTSLPLSGASLLVSLRTNVPRLVLEATRGTSTLGYFAAVASLPEAGKRIMAPLTQASLAPLASSFTEDQARFRTITRWILALSIGAGVVGVGISIVYGEPILSAVFGSGYGEYERLLIILSVAVLLSFLTTAFSAAITATRRFRVLAWLAALSTGIAAILAYPAITRWGISGAAITELVAMAVWTVATALYFFRRLAAHKKGS